MDTIYIGMLGAGNVGSALARHIAQHGDLISQRAGGPIQIARVGVRNSGASRELPVDKEIFTSDLQSIITDPAINLVVEVMGGVDPPRELLLRAMKEGKSVVSANKELIARHGEELFTAAQDAGVDFLFEASVAGGIPIMRPLRESLAGEPIRRVMGIVNGTTNYILSKMADDGATFDDALGEAQQLGYAESDPTADVEGFDAASKAAIIAMIAFSARIGPDDVGREGISRITDDDAAAANRLGYVIKLLAVAEERDGFISAWVRPTMVPKSHPLASVRDAFNAVFIEGASLGELMLYGRGAGGEPTASAVLGDIIDAAKNLRNNRVGALAATLTNRPLANASQTQSKFFVRLFAKDEPGVLAQIASAFGESGVSIQSMNQIGGKSDAELALVTHDATEAAMQRTLKLVDALAVVDEVASVLRVI